MSKSHYGHLHVTTALIFLFVFAFCIPGTAAFGAEGKAFRHGDIEDTLEELLKKTSSAGGGFALGSLLSKGSKFKGLDIKRVYFGNWLRDYSQAVDIAGLKKLPLQTIINLCMVLGFMIKHRFQAHGYATAEFEVTEERLGVYLPTEHIDNPKGYGEGEDSRKELEVDPRTGMKNYIANESGSWDTSKALIRGTLERCIHYGRLYRSQGRAEDEYESFRLLGQALHTLEDFSAHSNFCELALVSLGYHQVFVHVGDQEPLAEVILSTACWAASVSDLNKELENARVKSASGTSAALRQLLGSIPSGGGSDLSRGMDRMDQIRAGPQAGEKRPEEMSPQELHAILWQVLSFRDTEKIPGLGSLIDKLTENISVFIYTTLEPYLKPLLQTASTTLSTSSAEVINNEDQFEVFDNPRASDPTHSFLSKDHFNLILNEPAGNIAKLIVAHTVKLVVKAWDDPSMNVHGITEDVLSCLFHPDFHDSSSQIQREMLEYMRTWLNSHGHQKDFILSRLTKDAVRNHRNIRASSDNHGATYVEGAGHDAGIDAQNKLSGYLNQIPVIQQATSVMNTVGIGGSGGARRETTIASSTVASSTVASGRFDSSSGSPFTGTTYVPPLTGTGEASSYYSRKTTITDTSTPSNARVGQQEYNYQRQEHYSQPPGPPPVPGGPASYYVSETTSVEGSTIPSQPHHHHHHHQEGGHSEHHHRHDHHHSGQYDQGPSRSTLTAPPSTTPAFPTAHTSYSASIPGSQQHCSTGAELPSSPYPRPHPGPGPGPGYAPHYLPPPGPPPPTGGTARPPSFSLPGFPAPQGPPPPFTGVISPSGVPSFAPPPGPPPPRYPPPPGQPDGYGNAYGGYGQSW
ncbi:hypothetical protein Clacol_009116 [Clathrus columnatus]|uniref:Het-C-domain-containing protein n=1 Tax=Clathrus columnatus TaxID=1419009 RepID=A0AAV5AQ92_9AGAM|nr:hypothetical protein Clacol_009116 [Clathrus columnatus]